MTLLHAELNVEFVSFSYFSHYSILSSASKKQKPFKLIRAVVRNVWQGRKQVFLCVVFFLKKPQNGDYKYLETCKKCKTAHAHP